MKCRVCRGSAVIDIRRHNANFCAEHFVRYCHQQVERAIDEHDMAAPGDRLLVAVSGGKDSLALWDILLESGWHADGLYVGLGIGEYSTASAKATRRFADQRQATLIEIDLRAEHGFDIPTAAAETGRVPCSACGASKRHLFDRSARELGYDVLMTGHNLDDEAAVLFGNVLRWQVDYLARQRPVLAAGAGFPKKAKPLIKLSEREMAAYCVIRGIDYQVDECPMALGNKHIAYKELLNELEVESPGAKAAFYHDFLRRGVDRFTTSANSSPDAGSSGGEASSDRDELGRCSQCGSPAEGEICAFCRLSARVAGATPVPVELVLESTHRRRR